MMKAAIMHGSGDVRLETVAVPAIKDDEILVKVKACGICGSDLHLYKMGAMLMFQKPAILGHEFSGEVVEVGAAVPGLQVGDRVLGTGHRGCGQCFWCQQGEIDRCPAIAFVGWGLDGAFAEYVAVPNPVLGKSVFKIPEAMSWGEATLIEPLSVACHAVEQANIQPNDTVVVLGAGMIGQGVAQVAKAMGAGRVIVSEPSATRRAVAKKLGADVILNPHEENVLAAVTECTARRLSDMVFECSGKPAALYDALQMTRVFGKVLQVGVFEEKVELGPALMGCLTFRNIALRGCAGNNWALALDLVQQGKVRTGELMTHEFALENIKEAFAAQLSDEAIKTIIKL